MGHYDLQQDWSDQNNPFGVWTLKHGNTILPHVEDWGRTNPGLASGQPAWAMSSNVSEHKWLPGWFKVKADASGFSPDWHKGDIAIHTRDDVNGQGNGEGIVTWTAPQKAKITVSGQTWIVRQIGRGVRWALFHNKKLLSDGTLFGGSIVQKPFSFASGSAGPSALTIDVQHADEISLLIERTSTELGGPVYGDFVGVKFVVDF